MSGAPALGQARPLGGAPFCALLPDGRRLHIQHGPIDLIIEAFGAAEEVRRAYGQARERAQGLLAALVEELPVLRRPLGQAFPQVEGPVAQRMVAACWPYRDRFITPMAAVAGAVADEVLEAIACGRRLRRAYVNNGGDIALYLGPDEMLRAGIVADVTRPEIFGVVEIDAALPVRGVATSGRSTKGRGGRSFSLGIADSATVLAGDAAAADAAATVVGNAVDLGPGHPAIRRLAARQLDPQSDLGDIPVTFSVGALGVDEIGAALAQGAAKAEELCASGLIYGAVITLFGHYRVVSHGLDRRWLRLAETLAA